MYMYGTGIPAQSYRLWSDVRVLLSESSVCTRGVRTLAPTRARTAARRAARGDHGTHDVLSKWTVEIAAALTSTEAVRHRVAGAHIGSRAAVEVFQRAAGQLLAVPIVLAPPVKQPIHARHGAVVRLDPQTRHARIGPCGMQPVAQRQQGIAEVPAPLPL